MEKNGVEVLPKNVVAAHLSDLSKVPLGDKSVANPIKN